MLIEVSTVKEMMEEWKKRLEKLEEDKAKTVDEGTTASTPPKDSNQDQDSTDTDAASSKSGK